MAVESYSRLDLPFDTAGDITEDQQFIRPSGRRFEIDNIALTRRGPRSDCGIEVDESPV